MINVFGTVIFLMTQKNILTRTSLHTVQTQKKYFFHLF